MPKFLAIHPFPEPAPVDAATPLGQGVKAHCNADAYWVKSWAISVSYTHLTLPTSDLV